MLKKHLGIFLAAALFAAAAPKIANADWYSSNRVYLRSGPSIQYPVVAVINSGSNVRVLGCLRGWSWCNVALGHYRGWVSGRYLVDLHRQPIGYYHSDIPVYEEGPYWRDHYRSQPFYRTHHWHGERNYYNR